LEALPMQGELSGAKLTMDEFIKWCERVTKHNAKKL